MNLFYITNFNFGHWPYTEIKNLCVEENENNKNQVILVALNSFKKALNCKLDEFHEESGESSNENDQESDNLYNFDRNSAQEKLDEKHSKEGNLDTMKNNFVGNEKRETEKQQKDDDFWKEHEEVEETHPLKRKLMESFEEIAKSKSKFEINQNLNFIKLILCESSVKSVEEGFYLLSSEFSRIVSILSKILKIHEVDPLIISETFDNLTTVRIYEREVVRDDIQAKVKIMLNEFTEHMADVIEIGHTEILNEYYKLLNSYTMDLKKAEVSKIIREIDYKDSVFDKISFNVHFGWLNSQILGNFFFLKDIEPLVPLLVSCFEAPEFGSDEPENERLRQDVEKLFNQTFESFGYDQTKKSIEIMLLNDQKLYSIFFNWFYSQGFMTEERPKTAAGDFYHKEVAKEEVSKSNDKQEETKDEPLSEDSDGFPDENDYKLVESRPKTIEAFYSQADSEKKLENCSSNNEMMNNLELSHSDVNENNYLLTKSNEGTNEEEKTNKPLGQFLTEEKHFDTVGSQLDSKFNEKSLNHPDFITVSETGERASVGLSELRPENINERYEKPLHKPPTIDEDLLQEKLDKQRDIINKEWQAKLPDLISESFHTMAQDKHYVQPELVEEIKREHKRELEDKERQTLLLKEEQEEQTTKILQEMAEMRKMIQLQEEKNKEIMEQRVQSQVSTQGYSSILEYAKSNISNPMDLNMSIVVKDGEASNIPQRETIIRSEKLDQLSGIFDKQKTILNDSHDSSDEEAVQKESVFKLQEYLVETDDPDEISKPLLLCFLKNKTSKEKNIMLKSMTNALANEDLIQSLSDMHCQCLIDVFFKYFSLEKVCMIKYTQGEEAEDEDFIDVDLARDNIAKIQRNISNLLNSKDYTTIIKILLKILRSGLPEDFEKKLNDEREQYLKAMMKCLVKVLKVLDDEEDEDVVRVFDVLMEMNRLFKVHPPDRLKEGLPSLDTFNDIYHCLKNITDKMIQLQPGKVNDFMRFISQDKVNSEKNSFILYLVQQMSSKLSQ